jgi:hypothetical protein
MLSHIKTVLETEAGVDPLFTFVVIFTAFNGIFLGTAFLKSLSEPKNIIKHNSKQFLLFRL